MDETEKAQAVEWWNSCGFTHPLTCETSSHRPLVYRDRRLHCLDCGYQQSFLPPLVFEAYRKRDDINTAMAALIG